MQAAASHIWRSKLRRHQLVTQISTILLQRHNWASVLPTLDFSSQLNPPLFLQILDKVQINPQISLDFFNWVKANLGFQPDLNTHCEIIRILIRTKDTRPVLPILETLIQTDPPNVIVDCLLQACEGADLQPFAFSSLIECYARKGLYLDSLEVYRSGVARRLVPAIGCCNALLDALERVGDLKLAWCFCASITRNGVGMDLQTWSIVARIFYRTGKWGKLTRLLDLGIYNSVIFNLVIDSYCKCGKFDAALAELDQMRGRQLEPGFNTHSLILDRACEYGDLEVIGMVMSTMVERKLIPQPAIANYDTVIRRFCNLGRTFVAEMLYKRAKDDGVGLKDATFECMLGAFSKGGRIKEAILAYGILLDRGIVLSKECYVAFAEIMCQETPSEEVNRILIDLIKHGVYPSGKELSEFMAWQCRKAQWRDAEDLVNVIIEQGFLPDSSCCHLLMKHYCCHGSIDSGMSLHHKLVKSRLVLNTATYNQLLRGLCTNNRVEDAVNVFCHMRRNNVVSCASYLVMITGLCREKEMRMAMQVHDEMLRLGLKPHPKTYRRLISVFGSSKFSDMG